MPEIQQALNSSDVEQVKRGVTSVRKMLSTEKNPPIADVINSGVVPKIVELLSCDDQPGIQFEAAWALTNVASGKTDQTRYVVSCGAVPVFIRLLLSPHIDVCDQAVWALGNIAGDGAECRDLVLKHGILPPLLNVIQNSLNTIKESITLLRNATWTLSNLCRGKPHPVFDEVRPILDAIPALLATNDHDVIVDALWAISHMSDNDEAIPSVLLCNGLVDKLALALTFKDHMIITPALRSLGNIVTGTNEQTQAVLDAGVLPSLKNLLYAPRRAIQKEVCWMISNIAAGTKDQIQQLITAGIFPSMLDVMKTVTYEVKREACWCICNASINGSREQIEYIVKVGGIEKLIEFLDCSDIRIVIAVEEALDSILAKGQQQDGTNIYGNFVEAAGGIEKLEELQSHNNDKVYEKAQKLLIEYFNAEEDDMQDEMMDDIPPEMDFTGFDGAN